jgi:hypothetical protein
VYRDLPAQRDENARYATLEPVALRYTEDCIGGEGGALGYEALHVADAVLERAGDPATAVITRSYREVLSGDRLLPLTGAVYPEFVPHAPPRPVAGSVISVMDAISQAVRTRWWLRPRRAGIAAPHDSQLWIRQYAVIAVDEDHRRQVQDLAQQRGIIGVREQEDMVARLIVPASGGIDGPPTPGHADSQWPYRRAPLPRAHPAPRPAPPARCRSDRTRI